MTGDASTLIIQLVLLAAIILAPWFNRRSKRVKFVRSALKETSYQTHRGLRPAGNRIRVKRVGDFWGTSTASCRRADLFLPTAGFKRILSRSKPGTPPCKSGQLEKDLGLQASSLRQSALLITFEIMRSFFVGSKEQATKLAALHWWHERTELPHARHQR